MQSYMIGLQCKGVRTALHVAHEEINKALVMAGAIEDVRAQFDAEEVINGLGK